MNILILLSGLFSFSAPTPLEGIWLRTCQSGSMQVQMFENSMNYSNDIFFVDAACTEPYMSFSNDGSFALKNGQIDFQFSQVGITLYVDQLVSDYNQRKVCGFSDWKRNDPREITGLKCALFQERLVQVPRKGEFRYGIWKIDGSKLYYGQLTPEKNGTSPDKRPTDWDPRAYLRQR